MRILFITPYLPSLIRVRPYNIIQALAARGNDITLLALHPPGDDAGGLSNLRGWCRSVRIVRLPRWRPLWNAFQVLATSIPFQAAYSRSPEMEHLIRQTLRQDHYDVIHLEHLRGAELSRHLYTRRQAPSPILAANAAYTNAAYGTRNGRPPIVFDAVDSISLLFERAMQNAARWQSRLMARVDLERTRHYEGQFLQRFSRVLATSPEDRDALAELAQCPALQDHLVVLPNGVDLDYFKPLKQTRQPDTVIFSGKMSYHANTAAALDLVQAVMPHVWEERPDVQVWLVGKDPPSVLRELGTDPRVTVTGTVPDIRPYLGKAAVAVTPLRYGVGIQNKVLEAMAMGTPVVSTPGTCRAISAEPGTQLLVGDSDLSLSQAILSLLGDNVQRQQLGEAGRRYVEDHHDWDRIAARLESIYQEAQSQPTSCF